MMTALLTPFVGPLGKIARKAVALFASIPFVFFDLEAYEITVSDSDKKLLRLGS